jgi:N-acetylglucosaminyldiphosphoundecaprenol N-acetyl-beta-D-mannosaminyltransferase
MSERINIRGVTFDSVTFEEAVSRLTDALRSGKQTALYTPNSEIVQACIEDPSLYDVINSAELITPDGIGVVKAGKILGTPFPGGRVAGYDVGRELLRRLDTMKKEDGSPYGVYFLGGKPGVAETARDKLLEEHPGLCFAGCADGYFKKEGEESDAAVEKVNLSGTDVLFVCLGAPAQEKWILANRGKMPGVTLLLGLGGSLDGYAGIVKRAPEIFIKLGLEWFYRLCKEPWRIKRMMKLPVFYFGTWKYKLTGKNKAEKN